MIAGISGVICLLVPVLSAVATECQRGSDCVGTNESDTLYGTAEKDRIYGRGGDDMLAGWASPDRLYGGRGNDRLKGQNGTDHLYGGDGNDRLIAGNQPDKQGEIVDRLYGEAGADKLYVDSQHDFMSGGPGDDVLNGTNQSQGLSGGAGNDEIYGLGGSDSYRLDGGKDWGHDVIFDQESGRNWLALPIMKDNPLDIRVYFVSSPNRPEVRVVGGGASVNWRGAPFLHFHDGNGNDTIHGSPDRDRIFVTAGGVDRVFAGGGNDHIQATENDRNADTINCGAGHDIVNHRPEDDVAANCEETAEIPY